MTGHQHVRHRPCSPQVTCRDEGAAVLTAPPGRKTALDVSEDCSHLPPPDRDGCLISDADYSCKQQIPWSSRNPSAQSVVLVSWLFLRNSGSPTHCVPAWASPTQTAGPTRCLPCSAQRLLPGGRCFSNARKPQTPRSTCLDLLSPTAAQDPASLPGEKCPAPSSDQGAFPGGAA